MGTCSVSNLKWNVHSSGAISVNASCDGQLISTYPVSRCDTWGVSKGEIITANGWNAAATDNFKVSPIAPEPEPEPDPEPEADTPLVPTDVRVPGNFRVQESLCVRMHFDRFGDFEDDIELWSTPTGAQERIRQILFARDDVVSCEVVSVWRREKA